jgi:serine/threonine protein kinase
MEYIGGISLHAHLKQLPERRMREDEAKRLFRQLVDAMAYCHARNICHRDIKLENILLDDRSNNQPKLIDFGFSTCIPNA